MGLNLRSAMLGGCAVGVLAFAGASWAQVAPGGADGSATTAPATSSIPPASSSELGTIVVTARKRAEDIQKTPVAITAFTGAALTKQTVQDVNDLGGITPGLSFTHTQYDTFSSFVAIRGQSQSDILLEAQPSVGIYVDGVYQATTLGAQLNNLNDVDRVEILKGPQSTLYGRNTTGGAISIVTKAPDYSGFKGVAMIGGGNYGLVESSGYVNMPIIDGKVAAALSGEIYDRTDGFGKDITSGQTRDNKLTENIRGALRLDPVPHLEIMLRGDLSYGKSRGDLARLTGLQLGSHANVSYGVESGAISIPTLTAVETGTATPAQYAAFGQGLASSRAALLASVPTDRYQTAETPNTYKFSNLNSGGTSATITYDLTPDLSLKSITAYRFLTKEIPADEDGSIATLIFSTGKTRTDQFSQEFLATGDALDKRLKYSGGVFYYYGPGDDRQYVNVIPFIDPVNPNVTDAEVTDKSVAAYGQATYSLTNKLSITGGIRDTYEVVELLSGNRAGDICNIPSPPYVPGGPCSGDFTNHYTNISYTASIDYQFTPVTLGYLKTSKGFKAGGQNERGMAGNGTFANFAPETDTDYEAGLKTDLFDHRLRLDGDVFTTSYDGVQLSETVAGTNGSIISIVSNSNDGQLNHATINGFELEADARPIPPLLLRATYSYTHAYFTRGRPPGDDQNVLQNVPRNEASASAIYTFPTKLGPLDVGATYTYQSRVDYQAYDHGMTDGALDLPPSLAQQGGYGLLDSRINLHLDSIDTDVAVYGKNLTDRTYRAGALDTTGGGLGFTVEYMGAPRTYGIEVTKHF